MSALWADGESAKNTDRTSPIRGGSKPPPYSPTAPPSTNDPVIVPYISTRRGDSRIARGTMWASSPTTPRPSSVIASPVGTGVLDGPFPIPIPPPVIVPYISTRRGDSRIARGTMWASSPTTPRPSSVIARRNAPWQSISPFGGKRSAPATLPQARCQPKWLTERANHNGKPPLSVNLHNFCPLFSIRLIFA